MENAENILQVSNLTKKYSENTGISDISFTIKNGQFTGLVGENGAGKSTIFKCIVGYTKIDSGDIFICGESVKNNFEMAMENIGGIINAPNMYKNLTGYENLRAFSILKDTPFENIQNVIDLMNMSSFINKKVYKYSLGMKQRLGIGIALLSSPKFLLLDEPTNGLDPTSIIELRNILISLKLQYPDLSLLIASHNLTEIEKICDNIIIISSGKIISNKQLDETGVCAQYVYVVESSIKAHSILKSNYDCKIVDEFKLVVSVEKQYSYSVNDKLVKENIKVFSFYESKSTLEDFYLKEIKGGSAYDSFTKV